jgi:hypothetical protein
MSESEIQSDETDDVFETPDETLPVEWVPREDLVPNTWNPNDMIDDKRRELKQSIMDNGWTQPIVRKAGTDQIIDGEQRWHVAGDDRIQKDETLTPDGVPAGCVPVFDLDADETQSRVATMQMNVATGEHDADALGEILSDFEKEGVLDETTERLGMDEVSVDRLIERVEPPEEGGDPDEMFDIPWGEDADPDAMTRLDLLVTEVEYSVLFTVLDDENYAHDLVRLCRFARENGLMKDIRADRREESDRDPRYTPAEDIDHDIPTDEVDYE